MTTSYVNPFRAALHAKAEEASKKMAQDKHEFGYEIEHEPLPAGLMFTGIVVGGVASGVAAYYVCKGILALRD